MSLSREEAQGALRDVEKATRRSTAAFGYRMSSPHLIWWGLIWLIGYGAMAAKVTWDPLWPILSLTGTVGSFWIGWRMSRTRPAARRASSLAGSCPSSRRSMRTCIVESHPRFHAAPHHLPADRRVRIEQPVDDSHEFPYGPHSSQFRTRHFSPTILPGGSFRLTVFGST